MNNIGIQVFGLMRELAADPKGTLKSIREIGYDSIEPSLIFYDPEGRVRKVAEQVAATYGAPLPKSVWEYKDARVYVDYAESIGLKVGSCLVFFADAYPDLLSEIRPQLLALAEEHGIEEYVFAFNLTDKAGCDAVRETLDAAIDYLEAEGIHAAYHNHETELVNHVGEQTVLDYLLDICDDRLKLQFDIGWGHFADHAAEKFLEDHRDRIVSLHLKDLKPGADSANIRKSFVAIGTGEVPIGYAVAHASDMPLIEHGLIVDQDRSNGSMMDDIKTGYENVKAMLAAR